MSYQSSFSGSEIDSAVDKINNFNSGSGYCKMPDGTLICWGEISISSVAISSTWGSCYESTNISVSKSFPVTFSTTPTLMTRVNTTPVAFLEDAITVSTTGIGGQYWLTRPTTASSVNGSISWLAVGKWK